MLIQKNIYSHKILTEKDNYIYIYSSGQIIITMENIQFLIDISKCFLFWNRKKTWKKYNKTIWNVKTLGHHDK